MSSPLPCDPLFEFCIHLSLERRGLLQSLGVHITLRMRLECKILRRDRRDEPEASVEVLNEVVVDRGSGPYLTKIECWERNNLITKVNIRFHALNAYGRSQ